MNTPLEVFPVDRPNLFDQQFLFMVGANYEVQAHEGEESEQSSGTVRRSRSGRVALMSWRV